MRTTALVAGALILSVSTAIAKPREVRGCTELRKLANGGTCLVLKTQSGSFFALEGLNVPPPGGSVVVAVTGEVSRGGCPLRVIRGKIVVEKWTDTRKLCPRRP